MGGGGGAKHSFVLFRRDVRLGVAGGTVRVFHRAARSGLRPDGPHGPGRSQWAEFRCRGFSAIPLDGRWGGDVLNPRKHWVVAMLVLILRCNALSL